jgi:hypothetical protein
MSKEAKNVDFTQLTGSLLSRTLPASASGLSGIRKNRMPENRSQQQVLNDLLVAVKG